MSELLASSGSTSSALSSGTMIYIPTNSGRPNTPGGWRPRLTSLPEDKALEESLTPTSATSRIARKGSNSSVVSVGSNAGAVSIDVGPILERYSEMLLQSLTTKFHNTTKQ